MNDLIKKLAKQAAAVEDNCSYEWDTPFTEKFARLVAAECGRICYDEDFTTGSGYAQEITKRFGVEE